MKQVYIVTLTLLILSSACAPLVPCDQMPGGCGSGGPDLYAGASSSRMTADAALRQAQWQEDALTQTSQAPIIRITETAAAVMVQQTQAAGTTTAGIQTQEAGATQTAVWWTPTPNATQTAAFAQLNAQGTMIANNIARDQLELERQEDMNDFWARLPALIIMIIVLVIAVALMSYMRRQRYQPAKVGANGNVIPIMDIYQGTFTDIDASPNFHGSISNDLLVRLIAHMFEKRFGIPLALPEVTAARQDKVKERDQMIDLASRGQPGPSNADQREMKKLAGQQMALQMSETNLASRFKILDGSGHDLDVIDDQIITVLDTDWKEATKK